MISLPVPDSAHSTQLITLGGIQYELGLTFNTRDNRWRMSLSRDDTIFIAGLAILESQFLIEKYKFDEFDHGFIVCTRNLNDGLPVGRDNLGQGKSYILLYLTNAEVIDIVEEFNG